MVRDRVETAVIRARTGGGRRGHGLEGGVGNAPFLGEPAAQCVEFGAEVRDRRLGGHDVSRQHGLAGRQFPRVKMLQPAGRRGHGEIGLHRREIEMGRRGLEQDAQRAAQQLPATAQHERDDQQRDDGIEPRADGCLRQQGCRHDGDGGDRVEHEVEEGAADVEVVVAMSAEQQHRGEVRRQPHQGDGEHDATSEWRRMQQPLNRLLHDEGGGGENGERVHERGDDLQPTQPERVPGRGGPAAQDARAPRHDQRQDVAQVVQRVGEQRDAPGKHAADDLDDDNHGVEPSGAGELAVEGAVVRPVRPAVVFVRMVVVIV